MNAKRLLGVIIAIFLDIITFVIGITTSFVSLVGGRFGYALISFVLMLIFLVVFPLLAVILTRDKTAASFAPVNEKRADDVLSLSEIKRIASKYQYGLLLGKTARAIINQANLITDKLDKVREALNKRFERGSITWDRYMGVIDDASHTALNNLNMMAQTISVLDEREYSLLSNPLRAITNKNNNKARLEFYRDNKAVIDDALSDNEEIFNKLDKLTLELIKSTDNINADDTIRDIEDITNQIKYYDKG